MSEKRKVRKVIAKGKAQWKKSSLVYSSHHLINDSGVIAAVSPISTGIPWHWETRKKMGPVETFELAKQAAEEALADAETHGFRWKEVGPKSCAHRWRCDDCYYPCVIKAREDSVDYTNIPKHCSYDGSKRVWKEIDDTSGAEKTEGN